MNDKSLFLQTENSFYFSKNLSFEEPDPWSTIDMTHSMLQTRETEGVTAANIFAEVDLPEIYNTAYMHAGPVGDRIDVEALEVILKLGGVSSRVYEQITMLTVPSGAMYITRNEFNAALALLACAQQNLELSLLKVYQRRHDLPIPSLPNLSHVLIKPVNPLMVSANFTDDDPWRIPHQKGEQDNMNIENRTISNSNSNNTLYTDHGILQTSDNDIATTTTVFTTNVPNRMVTIDVLTDKTSTQALVKSSSESYQWFSDLDQITVLEAEREGFLFRHINYSLQSAQRQTTVIRRYSDFYWMWETLLKRYAFRVIPNLPPKKFSKKDRDFLNIRLEGLSRFVNYLVRHPIIKNDPIVVTFITKQTEFKEWKKSNQIDLNEEFSRVNPATEELEIFIPKDLDARLTLAQKRLPKTIEKYEILCSLMESIIDLKRKKSVQLKKYDKTLKELRDIESDCFVSDCQSCGHVADGYANVGTYMNQDSAITETEADSAFTGILECLKQHKEFCAAFLQMLDRKSELETNQINMLHRKIAANTAKINQNRGVLGSESEVERLDRIIQNDTEKMIKQQRRDSYIKYCTANELTYLHKQQAIVSLLYQDYVDDQLKYTRQSIYNWKILESLLHNLPKPEQFA